eukprot:TRINITY_DN9403_c0_g1_i2.p1 TRINITY_DN9403_c0_g1~~TRINITY_DN9403_c0_g1_i2.p1  ORF type:complete len:385 (+),score=92.20 TRINITY_DN9403_c0_g1_i2:2476-3630(+)
MIVLLILLFILHRIYKRRRLVQADVNCVVYTLQFLAFYPRISNSWPPVMTSIFSSLAVTNFDFDVIISSCAFTLDFWQAQILKVLFPFMIFLAMMAFASCSFFIQKKKNPRAFRNRKFPNPIERAISLYVQGLIGLNTYLIAVGLAPFRCFQQTDGTYTLIPSANLDCYDQTWMSHVPVIALGLLEIIAVPVILISIFWINRFDVQSNEFVWRYGMLTENYVPQFYWWEVVMLTRKTSFVMVVDLTNNLNDQLRAFLVEIVFLLYILAEFLCQPRSREKGHSAVMYPIFDLFQMFALLVSRLVFTGADANEVAFFQVFLIVSFVLLCCLLVGGLVFSTVRNVMKDNRLETTIVVTGQARVSQEFIEQLPNVVMTVNPNIKSNED